MDLSFGDNNQSVGFSRDPRTDVCQKAHTSVEGELADILSCTFAL